MYPMITSLEKTTARVIKDHTNLEKILGPLPYPILVSERRNGIRYNVFVNKFFEEEIGFTRNEIRTSEDWYEKAY